MNKNPKVSKLHKYTAFDGIDILQNLRILVQNPNNFNDPFEFSMGVEDLGREVLKKHIRGAYGKRLFERDDVNFPAANLEEFREKLTEDESVMHKLCEELPKGLHDEFFEFRERFGRDQCGVVSFCDGSVRGGKEVLLWAHYADSHKGLRVHFDVSKIKIHSNNLCKMTYVNERQLLDPLSVKTGSGETEKLFAEMLFVKSSEWSYEEEYRWLIDYGECFFEYDGKGQKRHYIPIDSEAIVGVDMGVSMTEHMKEAIRTYLKQSHLKHIVLRESTLDRKKYSLNYHNIVV